MAKTHNIIKRIKGNTPAFFRKLRNVGILLGTIAGGFLTATASEGLTMPDFMTEVCKWCVVISIIIASICQLTFEEDKK